jgi:hypothetical protein
VSFTLAPVVKVQAWRCAASGSGATGEGHVPPSPPPAPVLELVLPVVLELVLPPVLVLVLPPVLVLVLPPVLVLVPPPVLELVLVLPPEPDALPDDSAWPGLPHASVEAMAERVTRADTSAVLFMGPPRVENARRQEKRHQLTGLARGLLQPSRGVSQSSPGLRRSFMRRVPTSCKMKPR